MSSLTRTTTKNCLTSYIYSSLLLQKLPHFISTFCLKVLNSKISFLLFLCFKNKENWFCLQKITRKDCNLVFQTKNKCHNLKATCTSINFMP